MTQTEQQYDLKKKKKYEIKIILPSFTKYSLDVQYWVILWKILYQNRA